MVKVISLSNDAYEKLKALKKGRSFSEVVVELTESKKKDRKKIMKFAGIFKDDKEWINVMAGVEKDRKNFKLREVEI